MARRTSRARAAFEAIPRREPEEILRVDPALHEQIGHALLYDAVHW